ncbi:MAG: signal peptidase I, partial [Nitrosotalea sp.]
PIEGLDYPITKQEYVGKILYIIPQVGHITKLVTAKSILITISAIIGMGVIQHTQYRKKKFRQHTNTI